MNYEVFTDALNQLGKDFALRIAQTSGEIVGPFDSILVGRLLVVLLLCGLIGWERSQHERASGFRPHILVGLGACLMTMAGAYALPDMGVRDPMRVASYVVSGIGFLGAGAILRHGSTVRGLTTAASIWGVAGIGIAVGVGMAGLATATTLLILFTLVVLERVEARLGRNHEVNMLKLHLKDNHRAVGKALTALDRLGAPVKRATMLPSAGETAILRVDLTRPLTSHQLERLVKQLLVVKSIQRVDVSDVEVEASDEAGLATRQGVDVQHQEQMNLDDENLLVDLNEPEGQDSDASKR
ncbi:MgtC/SapB family protein [Caldilinea sp.]|jgi:putative Mg2+ transporter-C (MgtC) family protein|uniref:MgtC/SapB family protein n=1 Tax=Caldilinea sp. TaxID=2293560 RepID=UPI0026348776|nr:MgtC/SapB family protein [uncultured Caldilinea sp.]